MDVQLNFLEWANDTAAERTRADQIFASFIRFHEANPHVWTRFQAITLDLIEQGFKRHSSDSICHKIRWDAEVETRGEPVKMNDNYTAYYARMFQAVYPDKAGFFETRRRISKDKSAYAKNQLVTYTGLPGDETELLRQLAMLGKAKAA